ncbi:MAG: hypothetical protein E5Y65_26020 [Mesorhizobium sp.]|uniref:hypothetical protein n=1 Tax=Mesorhizobium sp. TaxID=1871066 RepID=UPI001214F751|nr:hypothetical protein [Mesorhizobium sp.]TIL72283.1 MAG: hypothetical protein E5Y70_22480 [Mesorhizobium sp.]TIL86607.1 MAG: hypothetical protein E5Y65_26020 [Mesorhizobium sp.]TIL98392.1 MAG: hypothetical protein E5Y64_26500 [Mesorhizobium sp.]TIN20751.1 MAG: hypothetical protein E5Y59_03040 [Mesorhizobium sp.]
MKKPKTDAKHNEFEQEMLGGFGQFPAGKPSDIEKWAAAIDSADRSADKQPGESVEGLISMLCDGEGDIPREAGRLIGALLKRRRLARRPGGQPELPLTALGALSASQVRLRLAEKEYRQQTAELSGQIARDKTRRGDQRKLLQKKLESLPAAIAKQFKIDHDTFAKHVSGSPSGATKRANEKLKI